MHFAACTLQRHALGHAKLSSEALQGCIDGWSTDGCLAVISFEANSFDSSKYDSGLVMRIFQHTCMPPRESAIDCQLCKLFTFLAVAGQGGNHLQILRRWPAGLEGSAEALLQ